jgi:hypothetical protein
MKEPEIGMGQVFFEGKLKREAVGSHFSLWTEETVKYRYAVGIEGKKWREREGEAPRNESNVKWASLHREVDRRLSDLPMLSSFLVLISKCGKESSWKHLFWCNINSLNCLINQFKLVWICIPFTRLVLRLTCHVQSKRLNIVDEDVVNNEADSNLLMETPNREEKYTFK